MTEAGGPLPATVDDHVWLCRDCEVGHLYEESKLTVYCPESVMRRRL